MLTGNLAAILAAVLLFFVFGLYGAVRGRAGVDLTCFGTISASAVIAAHALFQLVTPEAEPQALDFPIGLPWLSAQFRLDPLASWFLVVLNVVGSAATIYTLSYVRHMAEPRRLLPFLPMFLAAMNLVPLAGDAFTFLVSWEAMSLASWLLILANQREAGNAHAASVYLVTAAIGTGCLILAFGILGGTAGEFRFEQIRAREHGDILSGIACALVLVGTGLKAGLVPLHAWLPLAHPAAPAPVSALMSGAMTKVAVYGLVRVFFDLAGELPWGWGAAILALGAISAVVGILYALMEQDLKTLLAYSTVENIGLIMVGFGLALVFRSNGQIAMAALALIAALFHVLNHALFKSLLFFVAGAVATATGERQLDRLGGLIHRMPLTAAFALVGAAAIAALPPLNGFISEWLTFQSILTAPSLPQWPLKFGVPVIGAALALAAALAAACFVRAFGIAFLGRARSPAATTAREADPEMVVAMALLAGACIALGLAPQAAVAMLSNIAVDLVGGPYPAFVAADSGGLASWIFLAPFGADQSSYSGVIVLAVVATVTAAVAAGVRGMSSNRSRRGPAWDCGYPDPSASTQYTAVSFAQPIRRVYGAAVMGARERVDLPEPGDLRPARLDLRMVDVVWTTLYSPPVRLVGWLADRMNVLQFQTIRRYLVLMFVTLIALLSLVAVLAA